MKRLTTEELNQIKSLGNAKLSVLADIASKQFQCSHCGKCTRKCEVLYGPNLDMGKIETAYNAIMERPASERAEITMQHMAEDYAMYNALRQCCFCGYCTSACKNHVAAPVVMRAWRGLFSECGLMPPDQSKLVMVDNEWNIFSAYRAIYQIAYPDIVTLDQAVQTEESSEIDTLLFPGCSLVSYAPEVVQALGKWLTDSGINWCMSDACCGSPLMSAGLFERADNLRASIIDKMQAAGIKRFVTICPGCADEFRDDMPFNIEIVPLPELLLEMSEKRERDGVESGFNPIKPTSVTFFDSCHDREDTKNARALRKLFAKYIPDAIQLELDHHKQGTLCCGAGGAVASYDPAITDRRVWRVIDEAKHTHAQALITMCPTCTYTIAQANLTKPDEGIVSMHYLEALFGIEIDWSLVFYQLNAMWSGEWGPWLNATFF